MVYCFEPALRRLFGNILANVPSRKMTARMAISVISTGEGVIAIPALSTGKDLLMVITHCLPPGHPSDEHRQFLFRTG